MYGVVAVGALAVGWIPVGLISGIAALGLGIAWMSTTTETETVVSVRDRPKPDWMLAMDDPDAPDLSRPEYRTDRRGTDPHAADIRAATDENQGTAFDRPEQASDRSQPGTTPDQRPPVPPTPEA